MLLLISLLCFVCAVLIIWGFTGWNRSLRFPSLFAASMAGFAVPQVVGLNQAQVLPAGALEMFIVMAVLCMACAMAGDLWGFSHPGSSVRTVEDYDERRITEAALILNAIASFASLMIQLMFSEAILRQSMTGGGATGPMVFVTFFASVHRYGFALALMLFLRKQSALSLILVLFGVLNYFLIITIYARRGPAVEFAFIVLLAVATVRRKHIPAAIVTGLFVVGTLWSTNISHFRDKEKDWVELVETADPWKSFTDVWEKGGLEVQNGADVIWTCAENDGYEYGKYHWNRLVHSYFPGQIFGHDVKQNLMFDLTDVAAIRNQTRGTVGAAQTAMADCFTSFGYFGCLKYLVIGAVMGRWYRRAFKGDLAAQLAYSTLMSAALQTLSHGTSWLMTEYIHMAIFSYPLLYWARKPAAQIAARVVRRRALEPPVGVAPALR